MLKQIKRLLKHGADINGQNIRGQTPLHYCFTYGFERLAEYLVSKGADETKENSLGLSARQGLSLRKMGSKNNLYMEK